VSVVSALAVVAFYRFAGNTASPVAVPQLASSATRPVQIVTVRPPPTMPDEGSSHANQTTAVASAAPMAPVPPAPAAAAPTASPATIAALEMPHPAAVR